MIMDKVLRNSRLARLLIRPWTVRAGQSYQRVSSRTQSSGFQRQWSDSTRRRALETRRGLEETFSPCEYAKGGIPYAEPQLDGASGRITIQIPGKEHLDQRSFDLLYLRDSCTCARCVDPSTSQKVFETAEIPLNIAVEKSTWLPDKGLEITWKGDLPGYENHHSLFPAEFLAGSATLENRMEASRNSFDYTAWDRPTLEERRRDITFDFGDYMNDKATFRNAVYQLHNYGIVFLSSVPSDPVSVENIAKRIGPLRQTFYGETWDVKSRDAPINVAYTNGNLDFHMDLLYMANPPAIQILHCIKQSAVGGESKFSDTIAAFYALQDRDKSLTQTLVDFPITYRYKNNGQWYQYSRPLIEGGSVAPTAREHTGEYRYPTDFDSVNWGPQFQGPLEQIIGGEEEGQDTRLGKYVQAAKQFKHELQRDDAVYETKMKEGMCVIFNNRRIVHARKPFTAQGGERWLRGCYVDMDCLRSKWRMLMGNESGKS